MANDSLSGVVLTAFLAREMLKMNLNHSYRIIFIPETIGAITYCAKNESNIKNIDQGLVITTCAGPGEFGYKQSWNASNEINKIVERVFKKNNINYITYPFDVHGSDERQYSSLSFRINCVTITKDKYYEYDYYHTSLDDLNFVTAGQIYNSLIIYLDVIYELEGVGEKKIEKKRSLNINNSDIIYMNLNPNCEPMLSKYDLYDKIGGLTPLSGSSQDELVDLTLWLLFLCDGSTGIKSISKRLSINENTLILTAKILEKKGLLKRIIP